MDPAKLPIVFHPRYDISLFGLENRHPFDSKKYGKVFRFLQEKGMLTEANYHEPEAKVSDEVLLEVHTPAYLKLLRTSRAIAAIAEMPVLRFLPNWMLQWRFLNPMRWATAGTLLGARLAMTHGWAVNLSGGYHHAKRERSSGFCFFADINLAAYHVLQEFPAVKKVMVIDLDAHQGNGFEDIFGDDPRVDTFDMYNGEIYPYDLAAAKFIRFKHPLPSGVSELDYLAVLQRHLPQAITDSAPDFIIYNAGSDPYEKDALGRMRVSAAGIVVRDEFVFRQAHDRKIPILMVLSGGYHKDSASIIASSVHNVWKKLKS